MVNFEYLKKNELIHPKITLDIYNRICQKIGGDEEIKGLFVNKRDEIIILSNKRIACFYPGRKGLLASYDDMTGGDLPLYEINLSTIRDIGTHMEFNSIFGTKYYILGSNNSILANQLRESVKQSKQEREEAKEKGDISLRELKSMSYIDGLPYLNSGASVTICLYSNRLVFSETEKSYKLLFEKISNIKIKTEEEIRQSEKERNVIKRAVAGGILLGPLGAIVGGMSGITPKKEQNKVFHYFLIISYISKDKKEKSVMFVSPEENFNLKELEDFVNQVQNKICKAMQFQKGEMEL